LLQDRVVELVAVTVVLRILTVDHPVSACLWIVECPLRWLNLAAGVGDGGSWVVKAWSGDIKMLLPVGADWVAWWAVVSGLKNNGGAVIVALDVTTSCELEAFATSVR